MSKDHYFQAYEAKGSVVIGDSTLQTGISYDPAVDKTSEKKSPANLKINPGEEKTSFGKKTHHSVAASFIESATESAKKDSSDQDQEKETAAPKKAKSAKRSK